ncbi:hypothetical protein PHYBOEH_002916 [Phytophthora boehmeriae]|uniref:FYVE-type domain-containing protein n=1 Tax=Phytophthora boehmeriae TaxID=109152 RepID=A0A8T1WVU6_9STRA|nr:hypothetical protein PHYBOEH_002916 [Phytophthora boehmeriae]
MEVHQRKRVAITSSFFPVDEGLLPQLNISEEQHEELRQFALQAALDAVRDGPSWGRSNVDRAVAGGWKVVSARPTSCFLTKKQTKKGPKKPRSQQHNALEQDPDDKQAMPPTPRVTVPGVTSLGSFHGADITRNGLMPFAPFAPVPLEAATGQHFMGHAILPNTLEDVMNTLYCEHTREMRALKRKVYGEVALDCCVLQTLEGATLEDPFWYIGLKWLALRSPMQALMASREFVYLEHLGTHVDPETGRRMLYRVTQSVHVRGYGGQDSYFGLTRGHIEAAFVYWMDDENEVRNPLLHVSAKGRIHMKGSMPSGIMYKYLKSFWRSERSLFPANRSSSSSIGVTLNDEEQPPKKSPKKKKKKKSKRRKVPVGPPLEMAHEWVADELRPRCSVCNKKFRLVRRFKHHCRACGEVICRECTFHHRLNVRASHHFGGIRRTMGASMEFMTDTKQIGDSCAPATNFDATMTCSFDNDNQLEEDGKSESDFDPSMSLIKARDAVNGGVEPAILGDTPIVCVVMAKVCLRCLHSVPLTKMSNHRRRHSTMAEYNADTDQLIEGGDYPLRPLTWTPNDKEIEELDGLDDHMPGRSGDSEMKEDLPILDDDIDAVSVDGVNELKGSYAFESSARSFAQEPNPSMFSRDSAFAGTGSYVQDWPPSYGQEDGTLDSNANHERVMILSPHALSTSSSVTSAQMKEFMETDESSHESSHHSYDVPSDIDEDNDSIQFYPTQTNGVNSEDDAKSTASSELPIIRASESGYTVGKFDPNDLFELDDKEKELNASAQAAKDAVTATEKVLRRMRGLQDEAFYQNCQLASPSSSMTSLFSGGDNEDVCSEIDAPVEDLRQALAQMESSLADQARLLFTIEQERQKDASDVTTQATSAKS